MEDSHTYPIPIRVKLVGGENHGKTVSWDLRRKDIIIVQPVPAKTPVRPFSSDLPDSTFDTELYSITEFACGDHVPEYTYFAFP